MELGIYNGNFAEQDNQNNPPQNNDKSKTSFFLSNYKLIKTNDNTSIAKPKNMLNGISHSLSIDHYIAKLINLAKLDTRIERLAIDLAHKTSKNLLKFNTIFSSFFNHTNTFKNIGNIIKTALLNAQR